MTSLRPCWVGIKATGERERVSGSALGRCRSVQLMTAEGAPLTGDGASLEVTPDVEHRDDEDAREAAGDRESAIEYRASSGCNTIGQQHE